MDEAMRAYRLLERTPSALYEYTRRRESSPLPRWKTVGPGGCDCGSLEEQSLVHDHSSGDVICRTCANVVQERMIDESPEWFDRSGDAPAESRSRASKPGFYDQFIGPDKGAVVPENKKRYAEPDTTKNLRRGLDEVRRCGGLLGLDAAHQMCVSAMRFYTDYAEARKAQGRAIREAERTATAACSLYFGCKSHARACDRGPRTIKEISGLCKVPLQDCTALASSFKDLLAHKPYKKLLFHTVMPEDLISRAAAGIAFESTDQRNAILKTARSIFERVRDEDLLEGRTPETVCSAVLFRAFELTGVDTKKMTKKMVYQACAVSNVSLNKGLEDLRAAGI